jgi:neutral ceramidase
MRNFGTLAAVILVTAATNARAGELKAGAATADITPPVGIPMWGYAVRHDAPSVGVRDELYARAVVLDDGDEKLLIVSLDLGRAPARASTARIRERLRAQNINHMLLVASHTHHGPVMELDDIPDVKNPYTRTVEDRICDLAAKALKDAAPARVGVAAKLSELNRNRHSKRADAPVDKTLTVLRVETTDGKPIATLVNFAAHPTMLDAKLLEFSAEWPGAMAKRVQEATGAPCLFLQGASGDLTTKPPQSGTPDDFGAAVAEEVLAQSKTITCNIDRPNLKAMREEFRFPCLLQVGDPLVKFSLQSIFFPGLVAFYEREYREAVRPEVTTIVLTDQLGLVGFSGEMFCGHALSLRRRARMDHLLICGYCNDYQQYFPTIEAISEGGYGTAPPVAVAEPGAGERMTDRALLQLYKLRRQVP